MSFTFAYLLIGKVSPTVEDFNYVPEKEPLPPINGTQYANEETSSRDTSSDKDGDDKKKETENVVGFFELVSMVSNLKE